MKRTGILVTMAAFVFFLVAGAYSNQEELAVRQQQEQMEKIGRKLEELTTRANQLAKRIRQAETIVEQGR